MCCLFFPADHRTGTVDRQCLHEAEAVHEEDVKWVLQLWVRQTAIEHDADGVSSNLAGGGGH